MAEWWNGLDGVLRALYCIAVPATLLFFIQTILAVVGGLGDGGEGVNFSDTSGLDLPDGADGGTDLSDLSNMDFDDLAGAHHTDGSGVHDASTLRLLSLQTVVAFLTVFGWSSIVAISTGSDEAISLIVGLALGLLAMFLVAKMVQATRKLAENGTLNPRNAIGESGKVYLPIPPKGQGEGKVMLEVQGQLHEFEAITLGPDTLKTGSMVRVTDLRGEALVVEPEQ